MSQPCPGGARPKPGLTSATVLLDIGALASDVIDHITRIAPSFFLQRIWGRADVATLCSQRPEDPGPPSAQDLAQTAILAAQVSSGSAIDFYGSWVWKQLNYQVFLNSCECTAVGEVPPPHIVVPPPDNQVPWPTGHEYDDPLTRIENNQQTSTDAIVTLYNGLQRAATDLTDLRHRQVQSFIQAQGAPLVTMSGEGQVDLDDFRNGPSDATRDVLGVVLQVDQLPTKYKVQGALNPRYYGIGHITWNADVQLAAAPLVAGRHSLHYLREFVQAPQLAQSWSVYWRLMPGAVVRLWQVFRQTDNPIYTYGGAYSSAFDPFAPLQLPPGWTDHPIYPVTPTRTVVPRGGGLPP